MRSPSDPPISYGTPRAASGGVQVSKQTEEAVSAIFEKALKETNRNRRSVGEEGRLGILNQKGKVAVLWQPHNYRLYIDFDRTTFTHKKPSNRPLSEAKGSVAFFNSAYTYSSKNHGAEHMYKDFCGCTIVVKKNQVLVINKTHFKQWRLIEAESIESVNERIDEVMTDLYERSIFALKLFIKLHGGKSDFKILNRRCEHGIHGEDYLDRIPQEMVINDTTFKKVYSQKVEFKDVASVKNYIGNRTVESIAPLIVQELRSINRKLQPVSKSEKDLFEYLQENNLVDAFNESYYNGTQKQFVEEMILCR